MISRQQFIINNPTTWTQGFTSPQTFGFGGLPKTALSLQATFYTGLNGTGSKSTTGMSGTLNLLGTNDGTNFDSVQQCLWTVGTQANSAVTVANSVGPFSGCELVWSLSGWGTANSCVVTVIASGPGGDI